MRSTLRAQAHVEGVVARVVLEVGDHLVARGEDAGAAARRRRPGASRTSGSCSGAAGRSARATRPPIASARSSTTTGTPSASQFGRERQARRPGADHDCSPIAHQIDLLFGVLTDRRRAKGRCASREAAPKSAGARTRVAPRRSGGSTRAGRGRRDMPYARPGQHRRRDSGACARGPRSKRRRRSARRRERAGAPRWRAACAADREACATAPVHDETALRSGSRRRPRAARDPARRHQRDRSSPTGRPSSIATSGPRASRSRWQSVWLAAQRGTLLPPISVVPVGDAYAIRDGHHRVSVARARGALTIDAIVSAA